MEHRRSDRAAVPCAECSRTGLPGPLARRRVARLCARCARATRAG